MIMHFLSNTKSRIREIVYLRRYRTNRQMKSINSEMHHRATHNAATFEPLLALLRVRYLMSPNKPNSSLSDQIPRRQSKKSQRASDDHEDPELPGDGELAALVAAVEVEQVHPENGLSTR